ncbi:hypothetical protein E4L95_12325 [Paracoccus liaowanqingii]|uniref:Uncharacterized protein n=1 Tax=Paracoccus liaowanqingii TaxID=2560053 RepID=A0A4Z1BJZ3_9RHOB|nr:hypothetical protein [Paracoccus liaowanqingii]TGN58590.1 hypothetical protein E4L95_12325 [Paracoccus liaowanqingii]
MSLSSAYEIAQGVLGVDLRQISDLEERFIWMQRMNRAIRGPAFSQPKQIEAEVEGIRKDIRKLRQRIEALGHETLVMARQASQAAEYKAAEKRIAEASAARDDEKMMAAAKAFVELGDNPKDWHDIAAARHLAALEEGFRECAKVAVELAPIQSGRPKNQHAYMVAEFAVQSFTHFTGQKAGFWNGGDTPFMRYTADLCDAAGVKADLRTPIEAAMRKLGTRQ